MKITDHVYLIGSGAHGLSNPGDCHVYLLDAGSSLALIDAGCGEDTGRLIENLQSDGLDPASVSHVLITHAHRDHAAGAAWLRRNLPKAPAVLTSISEADLLERGSPQDVGLPAIGMGGKSREEVFPICRVDRRVANGEVIEIGALRITAFVVEGHNPGCVCWFAEVDGKRVLFSGDVIFVGGYVSIGNWRTCDPRAYGDGLRKLAGLRVDALLSGHHVWTLAAGQHHIDRAIAEYGWLWPPPGLNQVRT